MAFRSLFRRASSSPSLPLAIRRAVAPKFCGCGSAFHPPSSSLNYASAASVSSAKLDASQKITKILNREIKLASKEIPDLEGGKPIGFPFEVEDNPGTKTVLLKRKFRNELITVMADLANGLNDEKKGDSDGLDHVCIPLAVTVQKGLHFQLEFGVTAYPDEIVVEYMVTKSPRITDHGVPYEGRDFRDLEENMQKAIFEYLAIRGIEPNVTGFLIAYMMAKGGKEYVHWLKILRQFCR